MIFSLIAFILFVVGGILAFIPIFPNFTLALGLFGLAVMTLDEIAKEL